MIDLVTSNFDNVIVVYNGANAFEMGWVKLPQIKGVLLCPGTGQSGFEGFGRVVAGEVNLRPHRDTYVTDLTALRGGTTSATSSTPTLPSSIQCKYVRPRGHHSSFVNYVEGIYVGYKFYETAADEGLIDYDKEVVYPFGYGLSYTTFTQKMSDITNDGADLKFSVTVTNTGSVAGKDVVEIYSDPPYTNGGIEKAPQTCWTSPRPASWPRRERDHRLHHPGGGAGFLRLQEQRLLCAGGWRLHPQHQR
ncbi:MAG: hypothetical protein ACLUIR_03405 [Faecalibacterium prausnitzii]